MAELVANRERTFGQEHTRLDEMHRRDMERARNQELERAREPRFSEIKPPDRGGGFDR